MDSMTAIIAAVAKNGVIGRDGKIPWQLPEDRKWFREQTMGHMLVMGRRTYEEIGRPLPGRRICVLSSRLQLTEPDCFTARSLCEALKRAGGEDVFICGGASLYEEALPLADRLYLTELDREVSGDTFFPEIPEGEFAVKKRVEKEGYAFVVYDRKLWRY